MAQTKDNPEKPKFMVSYDKDDTVNMNWIMAMEYQRIWIEERDSWKKFSYPQKEDPSKFFRGYVSNIKRARVRRFVPQHVLNFKLKRYDNVSAKVGSFRLKGSNALKNNIEPSELICPGEADIKYKD